MSLSKLEGEVEASSPTGIFPPEIWEVILGQLEKVGGDPETEAGLNIINASTQLQKTFKKETRLLAFKKVIRLLYENKWIDFRDLLYLRLVSKPVNRYIHSYINETRRVALFEAYDDDPEEEGQMEVMEQLRRLRMDRRVDYAHCDPDSEDFVGFHLKKSMLWGDNDDDDDDDHIVVEDTISKIHQESVPTDEVTGATFPISISNTVPLLVLRSAAVFLNIGEDESGVRDYDEDEVDGDNVRAAVDTFFDQLEEVFEYIGENIWSLSLTCYFDRFIGMDGREDIAKRVWEGFEGILSNVRNLRHLRIDGYGLDVELEEDKMVDWHYNFRFPTDLESIEVTNCGIILRDIIGELLRFFSEQLRRLSLPSWAFHLLPEVGFYCLAEVELTECDSIDGRIHDGSLRRFLDNLDCPLVRLSIQFSEWSSKRVRRVVPVPLELEVIHWLERFPSSLQSLEVLSAGVKLGEKVSQNQTPFPKLRYLKLEDGKGGLSFQFLRRLPSLQYLHVVASPTPTVWDDSVELSDGMISFKRGLEEGRVFDSNVWELLPELKTVTMELSNEKQIQFLRDRYERLKLGKARRAAKGLMEPDHFNLFHPLREDILEFLETNTKETEPTATSSSSESEEEDDQSDKESEEERDLDKDSV